ncbi:MAG: glycosyltransferase [Bacteroidetes bacterium]|nr:glycosyltransferase [Bacteroidota bacterium]
MYFSPDQIRYIFDLTFAFLCIAGSVQLIYLIFIHGGLLRKQKEVNSGFFPPVSIVVCARNESDNIYKHLPMLLNQDYPNFEVVIVNHQSTDDSKYILYAFQQEYSNLHIIEISRNQHLKIGKKMPLSMGIKGAKYDHVLLTDADCEPQSNQWLRSMASQFSDKNEIVLGYSPYKKENGWLNALIRFDTTWIGMNYLGAARNGLGYMGVGRNMGYKKDLFHKVGGFKKHHSVLSGDDDLFFQTIAKRNYCINIQDEAFVSSIPKETFEEWIQQKRRHLTTATHYKVIKKWMLGIYPLTLFILLVSFVILLFDEKWRIIALAVFTSTILIKWLIQGYCFRKLKEPKLIWYLPLYEILYFSLMPFIYYGIHNKRELKWR